MGGDYPTHNDEFKLVSQDLALGDKESMKVVFEADKGGLKVTKTFTFKRGYYGIDVDTAVTNTTDKAVTPQIYYQLTRDSSKPAGESSMYSTFTGPAFYTDEENFQKLSFSEIRDKDAKYVEDTNNGWLAMVQHHFVSAWVPPQEKCVITIRVLLATIFCCRYIDQPEGNRPGCNTNEPRSSLFWPSGTSSSGAACSGT